MFVLQHCKHQLHLISDFTNDSKAECPQLTTAIEDRAGKETDMTLSLSHLCLSVDSSALYYNQVLKYLDSDTVGVLLPPLWIFSFDSV